MLMKQQMNNDLEKRHYSSSPTPKSQGQLVSHWRLTIFPDGGISRVRIYGKKGVEELPPLQKKTPQHDEVVGS